MLRVAVLVLVLATAVRHAAADPDESQPDASWQVPIALLEHAMILVPPTIYYWNTVADQKEDWELRWDGPSWHEKLFSTDALVLDTNRFMPNGVRHPLVGALTYQVGRANGLSPLASLAIDFASAVFWEYIVEYRENPSINDIFCNTAGGFLIGEQMFQIGLLGDGESPWRNALSWLVSPFDRAQQRAGLSWRKHEPALPNELSWSLAPSIARLDPSTRRPELAFGLDLALVRDRAVDQPGEQVTTTGFAGWNRELLDLRFGSASDASGTTGARFRSETTYLARYSRSFDDDGVGSANLVALAGGFELSERRLRDEWDRLAIFELAGPRLDLTARTPSLAVDWQIAGYADVAMVQAHVFGNMPPPGTGKSVLLLRGYYYATGTSLATRLRVRSGRLDSSLDAVAHQFWSFDDHSHGGDMDPKGVSDQRVDAIARIGVRPTSSDVLVSLFGESIVRRGSWASLDRTTAELSAGLGLTARF